MFSLYYLYMDEPEIEEETIIEFEIEEYHNLIYSLTNNNWRIWYIDVDGEEIEELVDDIEKLDRLDIGPYTIDKEEIQDYINISKQY